MFGPEGHSPGWSVASLRDSSGHWSVNAPVKRELSSPLYSPEVVAGGGGSTVFQEIRTNSSSTRVKWLK